MTSKSYFAVALGFSNGFVSGQLGEWAGQARDKLEACAKAFATHWDARLDATGCAPIYETEEIDEDDPRLEKSSKPERMRS